MGESPYVVLFNFFVEGFSLRKSVDLLDPGCDSSFRVFEAQWRLPFRASYDFDSSIILVLLLKFRY